MYNVVTRQHELSEDAHFDLTGQAVATRSKQLAASVASEVQPRNVSLRALWVPYNSGV